MPRALYEMIIMALQEAESCCPAVGCGCCTNNEDEEQDRIQHQRAAVALAKLNAWWATR